MNTQQMQTNHVTLSGKITTLPAFSHEVYGEKFYEMTLAVKRLSEVDDFIPVLISERLLDNALIALDNVVTVVGQFRSYNKLVGAKSKLVLTVFARDIGLMNLESSEREWNTQLTMFAASQLDIMHTITSLTPRNALKSPGIRPQIIPKSMPTMIANNQTPIAVLSVVGMPSATSRAPIVPMRY